jgi:hypothetical protein
MRKYEIRMSAMCSIVNPLHRRIGLQSPTYFTYFIHSNNPPPPTSHTDKKENKIFLIYKEIQSGAVAKSYLTNDLLIYREIFAHFLIY